ncbi:hypothetical protein X742_22550 [Mesorhizobium sp. LNHC232B00]|nr:hypothetical protein X742_22550 [Mesorhizobium sp. LNHC232B00]
MAAFPWEEVREKSLSLVEIDRCHAQKFQGVGVGPDALRLLALGAEPVRLVLERRCLGNPLALAPGSAWVWMALSS